MKFINYQTNVKIRIMTTKEEILKKRKLIVKTLRILNVADPSIVEKAIYDEYKSDFKLYVRASYEIIGDVSKCEKTTDINKIINVDRTDNVKVYKSPVYSKQQEKLQDMFSDLAEGIKVKKGEYICRNQKCLQKKCVYFQKQDRGGDEGMSTFITCTVCGTRWRERG